MSKLQLTIATSFYDHVRDFTEGHVSAEGIDANFQTYRIEELFFRFTRHLEWDVAELSMGKFGPMMCEDTPPVIGLPVFPSRVMRVGSAVYMHKDNRLKDPKDMRGKRIGIAEWAQTAAIWLRGWMTDYIGVGMDEVEWYQTGVDQPARPELVELDLPKGVTITRVTDRSLTDMLLAGELDVVMSAHPPGMKNGVIHPDIVRFDDDFTVPETKYYEDTGIFPIMHVVVIRRDVYEAHPWIAGNLLKAFDEAKQRSVARVLAPTSCLYPVPWLGAYAGRMKKLFGDDYFPYGIEPNRRSLEAYLKWVHVQGIAPKHLKPEDLFAKNIADRFVV